MSASHSSVFLPVLIAGLASLTPSTNHAQSESTTVNTLSPIQVQSQRNKLDSRVESVSTATKTALHIKDVPQTVDTINVEHYKDYGITELSTMLDGVPNVTTSPDMRSDTIMIRGFAAQSGDIYLDGIRASGQVRHSTANIERVEVLKGPASVLYGRGSGGGIVNQVSKQARLGQESAVSLRAGSWQLWGGTLDFNRDLSPNIALQISADAENAHSFRNGIQHRNRMISPSIIYDNQRDFSWLLQYTYDQAWRVPDRGPAWTALPDDISLRRAFANPDDYVEDTLHYARSDMKYQFNDQWALRWVLAERRQEQNFDHMYGGSVCNAEGLNSSTGRVCSPSNTLQGRTRAWQYTDNRSLTTNLDLTGKFTLFNMDHDLLIGIDWSREQRLPELATQRGVEGPISIYNPVWGTKPGQGEATQHNKHQAHAKAIYLQDLISLSPEWKLMLGARTEQFRFQSHNLLDGRSRSYSGTTTSPRLGLLWQFVPEQSLYVSYSKNFSPYGGSGLLSVSVDDKAVYNESPEYSRQYEVGLKSDWLGNRLSTQIALFSLERYNLRYRPDPINEPDRWDVAGKERTQGIELSFAGNLVDHWYLRGGYGFQAAKVKEAVNDPQREGQYKTGVSRHNGHIFLGYGAPAGFFAETGLTYSGSTWADIPNTRKQNGYTRWDAMLGWRAKDWQATLAATNLTDKAYWRSNSMPGQPRAVQAKVTYRF